MTESIKKLSDYQHARMRTPVYFGSNQKHTQLIVLYEDGKPVLKEVTWVPAVYTAIREILDNALDEVVGHGYGNRIDIVYDENTKAVSITDNGRGIPIDWDDTEKCHKATLALSHSRAGRNFVDDRGFVAGQNGMGAACTNFCSEWFHLEIYRDKKRFRQEFKEGTKSDDQLQIGQPKIINLQSDRTGTTVEFKLSSQVFKDMTLPSEFVYSRIYEIALANPNVKITYNGEVIKIKNYEKVLFESKPITVEIEKDDFKARYHIMPGFQEEHYHSLVNNIPTFDGGTHIDSFRRAFFGGLLSALERESKRRKLEPNRSDVTEGLLIYNVTTMKAPNFNSQSKTKLINEEVNKDITAFLADPELYKSIIRKNAEWIDAIYARCEARTNAKDAGDANKLAKKNLRQKTPNLTDCSSTDRRSCYLFITEGFSGVKGLLGSRDPKIHAGIGLKGKVENVFDLKPKELLESKTLSELMSTIGLLPGERTIIRYGKICITTDADEDGKNITALLVNFFYKYWPELFDKDEPRIFVFNTPFIIAKKGSERHYWFAYNYDEFKPEDWKGYEITRAKGIGTLEAPDWKVLLNEIDKHIVPLRDDGKLGETMSLIFDGSRSDDRKEWLS